MQRCASSPPRSYSYGASTFLLSKLAGVADKWLIPVVNLLLKVGLPTIRTVTAPVNERPAKSYKPYSSEKRGQPCSCCQELR